MKLDTKSVLNKEQERKSKPIPLPSIKIGDKKITTTSTPEEIIQTPETKTFISETSELHAELSSLKRQRGKLSSHTAYLVQEVEKKLRAENSAIAEEFMKGNLPMPELAEHYKKIDALTMQATSIWDKIRHIEEHSKQVHNAIAKGEIKPIPSSNIKNAKYQVRRLDDLIHKTKKKLKSLTGGIKPKKDAGKWIAEYKEKIALAEAQREVEKAKLKTLKYE